MSARTPWWMKRAEKLRRKVMVEPIPGIAIPFGIPDGYQWSVSPDVLDDMYHWVTKQWLTSPSPGTKTVLFGLPVVEVEAPFRTMLLEYKGGN